MLIQSLEQTFTVIQLLGSSDLSASYLCRDYAQQNPSDYLLVQVKEPELVRKMVPVFMEFTREGTFQDFAGSFPKDGSVYGVFHYSSYPTWAQKRERENCSLAERLEIGKNLLDKMLLYRMPLYFQRHVLTPDRVCVAPSLEIGFRYELQDIGFYFSVTQEQVSLAYQQFFEDLFSVELELQSNQALEEFVLDCRCINPCEKSWASRKADLLRGTAGLFKLGRLPRTQLSSCGPFWRQQCSSRW